MGAIGALMGWQFSLDSSLFRIYWRGDGDCIFIYTQKVKDFFKKYGFIHLL